ncbi:thioredoxin family protein [Pseudomonas extremorientalis]|jgi:thioredoxin 1|uniref:Thiol reductase thioredoxin n=1 Tax=Pseudomonas extremorientalis TaxID=169669 RepID=A0A1H0KAP7_9PSED|nr:thioredoxin family protein [Pseudomonas extremorientalis]KAB0519584.1 thioredoxin family protein [Pseudomonas extremorientalis]OIN13714.1 thiol reductase thioredoxin [Pseudomonas extremorientalis]UUN86365.1 thioredoxin family protein [Pseudomonas extremorientalis]WLG54286.1 thioredoxin family protein [Pseudomonas extremorientalis]SDO52811.1 thioredoxin 1 [Pseudomonas extremorientalis]
MGIATATITNAEEYEKVLSTSHPVFLLFVSAHCPACADAGPLFELIAAKYPDIVSLVLDCANTPKHPHVTGTPTLLVYFMGELMEILKGFGPIEDQEKTVEELFNRYTQCPLLHSAT